MNRSPVNTGSEERKDREKWGGSKTPKRVEGDCRKCVTQNTQYSEAARNTRRGTLLDHRPRTKSITDMEGQRYVCSHVRPSSYTNVATKRSFSQSCLYRLLTACCRCFAGEGISLIGGFRRGSLSFGAAIRSSFVISSTVSSEASASFRLKGVLDRCSLPQCVPIERSSTSMAQDGRCGT